jgi:hypothetical protein
MEVTMKGAGRGAATITVQDKQRYEQPFLKCYGSVKRLTASGTGTVTEEVTSAEGNPCTQDPHKKPCN